MIAEQLHLRDEAVLPGRRLQRPWGMPLRVWELARSWHRRHGVEYPEAIRLALAYHATPWWEERKETVARAPAEKERAPIGGIRVLFRLDCAPEVRKRIQAGRFPGIEWVDGLGGVLEASRRRAQAVPSARKEGAM